MLESLSIWKSLQQLLCCRTLSSLAPDAIVASTTCSQASWASALKQLQRRQGWLGSPTDRHGDASWCSVFSVVVL